MIKFAILLGLCAASATAFAGPASAQSGGETTEAGRTAGATYPECVPQVPLTELMASGHLVELSVDFTGIDSVRQMLVREEAESGVCTDLILLAIGFEMRKQRVQEPIMVLSGDPNSRIFHVLAHVPGQGHQIRPVSIETPYRGRFRVLAVRRPTV